MQNSKSSSLILLPTFINISVKCWNSLSSKIVKRHRSTRIRLTQRSFNSFLPSRVLGSICQWQASLLFWTECIHLTLLCTYISRRRRQRKTRNIKTEDNKQMAREKTQHSGVYRLTDGPIHNFGKTNLIQRVLQRLHLIDIFRTAIRVS